jgi:hypothetical protein
VNAAKDGRVLYSTVVHLSDGKGNIAIPSSKAFRGSVLISAYHSSMSNSLFEGRRVSFPEADGLEIEPSFDKKTYAPGEQATLTLQLRNEDRSAQRGVFGVTVFDKAVEERARMDAEFGGRYSICHTCGSWFDDEPALPGLTVQDLHRVDRNQPVSPDLELAAEILLLRWYSYDDQPWSIGDSQSIAYAFHSQAVQKRIDALKYSDNYPSGFYLPRDEPSLREMVLGLDPEFDTLRDSWDNTYRLRASVLYDSNQIEIISSGADEVFNSGDDFRVAVLQWPYFSEYGKVLRTAIAQHHERTGGYVRDIQTLKDEVRRQGQDFDAWRDPQDKPYTVEFGIDRTRFTVDVKSQYWILWRDVTDYTAQLQPRIDTALNQSLMRQGSIPEDDSTLRRVLRDAGISDDDLKDPWGRPYYSNFKVESGYFDSVIVTSGLQDGVKAIPITQRSQVLRLRSAGPDGLEGTSDDFTAISFLRPVSQQTVEEAQPRFIESPLLDPSYGAVYGVVLDSSGAVIPGVSINLTGPTGREISVITAEDGHFQARNVDPGTYQIRVSLPGFQRKILTGVFVRAGVITRVVATLEVASVAQMVEVAVSAGEVLTTSSATVGEVVTRTGSSPVRPISTPRLREYFPETLLWQPALETGTNGRAQVRFKLADSITTWKAVAIASTKDGRIAVSEKEIVAFQPFFVEHDPPKLLTEGDQIALPVVVRSYLDRDQSIDLSMKNEDWFVPLDSASRKPSVKAGEFVREVFPFKAVKPVTNGKQRVTAQGSETSDAIEKTSTVYPFGREVTQVSNGIFRGTSSHNITVPPDALAGTVRAELKIYPNLMAHVADSIEGIMQRPYGCAEQVISSAYPSLLFLNYAKQTGRLSDPLAQKAKRYLAIALESLRGYQSEEGGFSYWTRGEPDTAVTAYAVQFLHGAEDFIEFDGEILSDARWWLRGQQGKDGSWKGNPKLTSYVVSVLSTPGIEFREEKAVSLAIEYLQKLPLQSSEPYVTASIALAALQSGNRQLADAALNVLRSQVHNENTAAYWMLETNTPFYGWGLPGRLETTALAVRALAAGGADAELVDKGLLFLLLNKDRYGMWYSTQATVRVLDVLVRLVGDRKTDGSGAANVLVNGVKVATVAFGSGQQPYNPVVMDLSKFMKQGANNIEVVEQKKTPTATVQLVESHYVPWNTEDKDLTKGPLRLSVQFDTTEAAISDAITVQVEAERIGFRGYGMMLAEIGLPPGAEVDRESMAAAVASSGWDLSRYDVLPDRVLVYVWPRAGGTKFEFKFRPRYGLEARSPASKLYDYYNPEAYSILTPVLFKVR